MPPARPRLALLIGLLCLLSPVAHAQIEELPRPDSAHAPSFGVSVALNDSIAVVGASGEANCGPNAGAVYVYRREPHPTFDEWTGVARLTPRTCRANRFFGERVAVSGERILVSASASESFADLGTSAAYVFDRAPTGEWRQTTRLTGAPGRAEGLFAADIDLDGNRAVVSTSGVPEDGRDGAVYVYEYAPDTETWARTARLTAGPGVEKGVLGRGVALDGNRLAVAASTYFEQTPGFVYIFEYDDATDTWAESAVLSGIDSFFIDLDLSGSTLLVGEDRAGDDRSGRATTYTERGSTWRRSATLRPSHPYDSGAFGTAVAIDGPWALVTGYGEQLGRDFNIDRVVYAFRRRGDRSWSERTLLDIGQVDFGAALDLHGSTAIVSSVPENAPGTVYVAQLR